MIRVKFLKNCPYSHNGNLTIHYKKGDITEVDENKSSTSTLIEKGFFEKDKTKTVNSDKATYGK